MNILVLDVGTSSMRGTLLDECARTRFAAQVRYHPDFLENGWAEQDPADWESAMIRLCREAAEQEQVDAVAITSQRSSVIPVDRAGRPLRPAIMWQDTRNRALCEQLKSENDWVFRRCGSRINTVYSGGKMAWFRRNEPDLHAKTWKLLVIPDYLIHRMTGEYRTDHTYASRSLLMDLEHRRWDGQLLELFGIPEEKLCDLVEPGSIIGSVTGEFGRLTGLRSGTPVVTCGGDQQCGAMGQGVFAPGSAAVNTGTGAYLLSVVERIPADLKQDVVCNAAAVPGAYILESSVLTCCSALDWLTDTVYGGFDYAELDGELAKSPPGAGGVVCLPYFQGRGAPDWNSGARGAFYGVSLGTGRADLLRALLEGVCCEISGHIGRMEAYLPIDSVTAAGGMTRSAALNQMQADIYEKPVRLCDETEATTRGAWMNAAAALGVCGSLSETWKLAGREGTVCLTDREKQTCYRALKEKQARLYESAWRADEFK